MEGRSQSHLGSTQRIFKTLAPFLILTFAILIAWGNSLHNDFLWDDEFLVVENSYLRDWSTLPKMLVSNSTAGFGNKDNFYRPTQNIYYLVIYQFFGLSKPAFHLGNILLHLINAFLVFVLLQLWLERTSVSLAGALLWSLHPTHVEAVTYVSGTADPMGTLFSLLTIYLFSLATSKPSRPLFFGSLVSYTLALMSKEAMIVTPALLVLACFYLKKESRWHFKNYLSTLPYWIVTAVYFILRKTVLNFDETFTFYKQSNIYTENISYRAYTFLATLPEYLKILFWPTDLHMERHFPVYTSLTEPFSLGGLLLVVFSFSLALYFWKKKKDFPLIALLWFFIAFVPMMGILIPVNSFILEHWLYLPTILLFALFAKVVFCSEKLHATLPHVVVAALAMTLIFLTQKRNEDWKTPITFYQNILKYSEGSSRIHNNLAMAYSDNKDMDLAVTHYLKAIKMADIYPQTHYNLARVYIEKQEYDQALKHLNRSLEIQKDFRFSLKLKEQVLDFLKNKK